MRRIVFGDNLVRLPLLIFLVILINAGHVLAPKPKRKRMLFSSQVFILIFLPSALLLWYLPVFPRQMRLFILLLCSLTFYAFWDPRFLPLLCMTIIFNWLVSRLYGKYKHQIWLVCGISVNLLILGFFKYLNFLAENFLGLLGIEYDPIGIILPLGISFFTFQQISYLVDLKKGESTYYSLLDYAAYVSFFPQLIAGPIVRHHQIIHQFLLEPRRAETVAMFSSGLVLLILGLVKKLFFADELGAIADEGFDQVSSGKLISFSESWIAALAYTFQLYFDFSAYSDMAIGLGYMFGLRLPQNFNVPYIALNLSDFWRRWHITLSNFLRDYVYIPLGGNQGAKVYTCFTVFTTMFLCGLWHGAAWTFVIWGLFHGIGIILFRAWSATKITMPPIAAWLITFLFVLSGWVLFRAEDFVVAQTFLSAMVAPNDWGFKKSQLQDIVFVGVLGMMAILGPTNEKLAQSGVIISKGGAILSAFLLILISIHAGRPFQPEFIYFQF